MPKPYWRRQSGAAVGSGSGTGTITWAVPEDSVATGQVGTKVYRSSDGGVTWKTHAVIPNLSTLTFTVTGLPTGAHLLSVGAYNAAGASDPGFYKDVTV